MQAHALGMARLAVLLHYMVNDVVAAHRVWQWDKRARTRACIWPAEAISEIGTGSVWLTDISSIAKKLLLLWVLRLILELSLDLFKVEFKLFLSSFEILLLLLDIGLFTMDNFLKAPH